MKLSLFKKATVIGASALALVTAPIQADWTNFVVAPRTSGSFTHAHHPDGRFIFGQGGAIRIQGTFGTNTFDPVSNTSSFVFDPAFIATRDATSALIGGGGTFTSNDGLFPFNPSSPVTTISASITSPNPNAYSGIWWQHPTSGRQGWLLSGTNADGQNNLYYVSADATYLGWVTTALSNYSGAVTVSPNGDVLTALTDLDSNFAPTPLDGTVLRFTASQIDAAIAAVISGNPAPIARSSAQTLFRAAASGSLAVDTQNRVWVGGFQIPYLQLWDPANSVIRRVRPLASSPANYEGSPNYQVKSFTQGSIDRISFLANDSFFAENSDLVLGHAPVADIESRSIQFTTTGLAVSEFNTTSIPLTVSITPPPTELTSVVVAFGGTATAGQDYTFEPQTVIIDPGQSTATLWLVRPINNTEIDGNRTITATLVQPTQDNKFGLGAPGSETFTITLLDDEVAPAIASAQSFPSNIRVGTSLSYQVQTTGAGIATKWKATGLPPGLKIDSSTGIISGTPILSGDFDRLVITASNAYGGTTSTVFLLRVAPLSTATVGTFTGFFDRLGSTTNGLGGRLDLVTTTSSTFTATVTVGKKRTTSRSTLNTSTTNPSGTISVNGNPIQFTIDSVTGAIIGNSPLGTLSAELTGWRNTTLSDRAGTLNFFAHAIGLPADRPQGANFGTIKIPTKGLTRIAGRTADGSAFTTSTALGAAGDLLIYQALYKNQGTFFGPLKILNNAAQSVIGSITWSKPSQISGALYRAGWNGFTPLTVIGGRYRPVAGASLPLDALSTSGNNASLTLSDGGISDFGANPRRFDIQFVSASRLITPAPLKLTVNNATGVISGSVPLTLGNDRRTATFSGLLVPLGNVNAPFSATGYGHFTLPTTTRGTSRTGLLTIESTAP